MEKRITALWHKLLVRNADYARDASLWRIQTEPGQPYLDEKTLLLEYFLARDQLIAFVVTADQLKAHRLSGDLVQIKHLLQLLWLNLRSAARSEPGYREYLTANVQGVAKKLYQLLIEPLIAELKPFDNLIIVPHGSLHYLPFHALYTGKNYLLQQYEVSYLPGSSLLRYCRQTQPGAGGVVAVGHSYQERLPHTLREAEAVAALWQGQVVLENAATLVHVQQVAPTALILHLATHGDFRPDNPLFSGLALADGWLTTLDIFNLRLKASLVTLSACQTGRSVVGGGDELLGLMRAFLGAGATSLVSTLWAVEDNSTAELMYAFYCNLAGGKTKGAALRQAQLRFIQDSELAKEYAHPYFWAPFFLVGDAGPL